MFKPKVSNPQPGVLVIEGDANQIAEFVADCKRSGTFVENCECNGVFVHAHENLPPRTTNTSSGGAAPAKPKNPLGLPVINFGTLEKAKPQSQKSVANSRPQRGLGIPTMQF